MASCNRWFRLFVNLLIAAVEQEKTRPKIPVLAILEEFHVLGHMEQIETAAALVAGSMVGTGIFVAETWRDLVITVKARDHGQLLELLRRLRQCVELSGMQAAGHQELWNRS